MSDHDNDNVEPDGIQRRKFLKGAATVAWAAPMILTTTAGRAGAASPTCITAGMPCNACVGPQCCDTSGVQDGGCCCSPVNVDVCDGVCVGDDATCQTAPPIPMNPLQFRCYAP